MRVVYIGTVIPRSPLYETDYLINAAGNLANLGIVEGLKSSGAKIDLILSQRVVSYYPKDRILFHRANRVFLDNKVEVCFSPLVNLFFLRETIRSIYVYIKLIIWALKYRKERRVVVVYNLFSRGVMLRLITRLLRVKLVPIIFDWLPVSEEEPDLIHRIIDPKWIRKKSLSVLEKCDGCFAISQNIVNDFAPHLPFRLIDGGVGASVVSNLPPIELDESKPTFNILYAGGIRSINHIDILLAYMEKHKEVDIRLIIAGKGDVGAIINAATKDSRIVYKGMLNQSELFKEYHKADVLVSLRDLAEPNLKYHFPSKTLEMLAVGKPLITTNSSHTKEVYGDYCKVIDECTLEAYEKALAEVQQMSPKERCVYGQHARDFILKEHTWVAQGIRMREFLEALWAN